MSDDAAHPYDGVSRRDFGALAATTGAASLAGCSRLLAGGRGIFHVDAREPRRHATFEVVSSGDPVADASVAVDGTDVGQTDSDGQIVIEIPDADSFTLTATSSDGDEFEASFDPVEVTGRHAAPGWFETAQIDYPIESLQYNPHVSEGRTHAMHGLFAPYAAFDHERGEFLPYLVQEWEHREDRMVATLREDVTWETGEPVDAAAIAFQWEILLETDHPAADLLTDVTASDEFQVHFHYEPGTDERIAEHAILHERADHPPADWEPVHSGAVDPADLEVAEPTSSGPLTLTDRTDEYHEYTVRDHVLWADDHPAGDHYNWTGYRLRHLQRDVEVAKGLINREIDGLHSLFVRDTLVDGFPDSMEEITFPAAGRLNAWFDHDSDVWGDRRVRRAVAHSLDVEPIVRSLGENLMSHHETQTGLSKVVVADWLGSATPEGFEQYDGEDVDVEALVEDAGYTFDELSLEFLVPAGRTDWVLLASQVADQLEETGWDAHAVTWGDGYWIRRANGEFDLVGIDHGDEPRNTHPYFSLQGALLDSGDSPATDASYEPPADVDVEGLLDDLATTRDRDEQESIVRDLALVVNRDLPFIHLAQPREQSFIDRDSWSFPEDLDSPHLNTRWALWWLPMVAERLDDVSSDGPQGLLKRKRRFDR